MSSLTVPTTPPAKQPRYLTREQLLTATEDAPPAHDGPTHVPASPKVQALVAKANAVLTDTRKARSVGVKATRQVGLLVAKANMMSKLFADAEPLFRAAQKATPPTMHEAMRLARKAHNLTPRTERRCERRARVKLSGRAPRRRTNARTRGSRRSVARSSSRGGDNGDGSGCSDSEPHLVLLAGAL